MKKLQTAIVVGLVMAQTFSFTGCASLLYGSRGKGHEETMYNWDNYSSTTFKYVKNGDESEESVQDLINVYRTIMSNQAGTYRGTIPPGVCADYGYLLVRSGKIEEGKELLLKEKELYPESSKFIDSIVKKIER